MYDGFLFRIKYPVRGNPNAPNQTVKRIYAGVFLT